MSGLLFVTASEATHKDINLALTYLRDWEYGDGDSSFKLVTTRNAYDLERPSGDRPRDVNATLTPVPRDIDNTWAGAPLEDIEAYCIDLDRSKDAGVNTHLYLVIDNEGLKDKTCILGERWIEWEANPITYPERFKKFRVPWDEAYLVWCNLDISNVNFEEFATEGEGDGDGWFQYQAEGAPDMSEENLQMRSDEIEKLRQHGRA